MESTLKVPLSFMAFSKIIPVNGQNIQLMYPGFFCRLLVPDSVR